MILSSMLLLFLLFPSVLSVFTCNNTVLTAADSPYSFGSSVTTKNYNGNYNCTWTVEVPYRYYAYLTTNSQLSSSDSVTIVYPGGNYTDQLTNAHPQNTFWLPEGESKIQFVARSIGLLSFNLQWNNRTATSYTYNITVGSNSYPQVFDVQEMSNFPTIFRSSPNSTSIALGVGGRINNSTSNPHPLRSCFLFNGTDKNRTFITTLDAIYPNVQQFGTVLTSFCVVRGEFYGYIVAQDGEGISKYSEYTIAYSSSSLTLTLRASGSGLVGVSVVVPNSQNHLKVTQLKLSDPTTTIVIRNGGVNNEIMETISQNNISMPFENHGSLTTLSISSGVAQFVVYSQSNVPSSANCASLKSVNYRNSPYYFSNGNNQTVSYWGPFNCEWMVTVGNNMYGVLELDGNLGNTDSFIVSYPYTSENRTVTTIDPSKKYYLPYGNSHLYFFANGKGTFQMKITWITNTNKTSMYGITSGSVYPVLFNIDDLNNNVIHIVSTDNHPIGISLATLPINNSISYPFDSCFIFDEKSWTFQKTLYAALGTMLYVDKGCYIYCVAPINYTSGYLLAASGEALKYGKYSVGLLTTNQQTITFNSSIQYMTITEDSHMHTDILNLTLGSATNVLTVSDGMLQNSVSYDHLNISYPIESQSQVTIFSITTSKVVLTVQAHNSVVDIYGFTWVFLIVLLLSVY